MRIVENPKAGEKVIRGRDWDYSDQDRNSVYGRVVNTSESSHWVRVEWISKSGEVINSNSYRIGEGGKYDLYYYEESKPLCLSDIVFYSGRIGKIIGFDKTYSICNIEFFSKSSSFHDGENVDYFYDEFGHSLPVSKGNLNRYYVNFNFVKKPEIDKYYRFKGYTEEVNVIRLTSLSDGIQGDWLVMHNETVKTPLKGSWPFEFVIDIEEVTKDSIETYQKKSPNYQVGKWYEFSSIDDKICAKFLKEERGYWYFSEFIRKEKGWQKYSGNWPSSHCTGKLTDISKIQEYLPKNHPDKIKTLEKGKWYNRTTVPGVFIKFSHLEKDGNIRSSEDICGKRYCSNPAGFGFDINEFVLLTDLSEISDYLPPNHPDKIFKEVLNGVNLIPRKWYYFESMYEWYIMFKEIEGDKIKGYDCIDIDAGKLKGKECNFFKLALKNLRIASDEEIAKYFPKSEQEPTPISSNTPPESQIEYIYSVETPIELPEKKFLYF